jgi:GNAT superfamily N-acetyltransferase
MGDYTIAALGPDTWEAFEGLARRHNGVWNGCWCTWFHSLAADKDKDRTAESNRALKERLVHEGRAHAALVFDGGTAVAWCQFGSPAELPNVYHRKEIEARGEGLPDYRVTCFFVDRKYRREGVAAIALRGALRLIEQAGGGVVESYPQDTGGKKVPATFLYNATRAMFEQAGFTYIAPKGKNHCIMRLVVP